MCRKLIAVVVVVMLAMVGSGCRKKPAQTVPPKPPSQTAQQEPSKTPAKSPADYNEAAKKEITSENMQTELDKIEKDIQREGGGAM
jgi:PBP1b-binding outer membrane lipoprotein LpoB